jgi:hypothetical protein
MDKDDADKYGIFDYFTTWGTILFWGTIILSIILPKVFPSWFLIGVLCLEMTIGIVGSLFFTSLFIYNNNETDETDDNNSTLVRDFIFHIFPLIIIFVFYKLLLKRFYPNINIIKSLFIPTLLAIIYNIKYKVQNVYHFTELNSETIIILSIAVWFSSYQIFI